MLDHAGEILILTGAPGSGKSTISEGIAKLPGSPKVHLHSDDFWGFIKNGLIDPWLPEAHAQNEVVIDAFARSTEAYVKNGYFVVLDGIIGSWSLPRIVKLGVPLHYIVLRVPLEDSIARCKGRGGDTLAESGPITQLHHEFADMCELRRHVMDVSGLARAEAQAKVVQALSSGEFRMK